MLKRPPHIVVTTPESLFILLTAEKSRRLLQTVRTVIVDEIHALAPNKRGTHLALSLERLEARFEGATGIAYGADDPVALAKVLVDFARDNPALSVKAGVVSGSQVLDAAGVKALSAMPGLPELRARLLGLLQAPATQLVRLLGTPATQLARVVQAHREKLEGE